MKAMQMKFPVEKPALVEGIKTGDQVQGKLRVTGSEYVITELQTR
jgi:Cu/Ag efflux protein CusF